MATGISAPVRRPFPNEVPATRPRSAPARGRVKCRVRRCGVVSRSLAAVTKRIRKPKATWVEPQFYADIEYRDITSEGLVRASSFKGLSKGTRRS